MTKLNHTTETFGATMINRKEFESQLAIAIKCTDPKTPMAILGNVSITLNMKRGLTLRATDLGVFFEGTIGANVTSEGGVSVNAKELAAAIKAIKTDAIELIGEVQRWQEKKLEGYGDNKTESLVDNRCASITLKTNASVRTMHAVVIDDYPALPDTKDLAARDLDREVLSGMIAKVIDAVSTDETRFHLNGAYLHKIEENVCLVSTDGHRMHAVERPLSVIGYEPSPESKGVIIPRKGLKIIGDALKKSRASKFASAVRGSNFYVRCASYTIGVKCIDSQFPDYTLVIPASSKHNVKIQREALEIALTAVYDADTNGLCNLTFADKVLKIVAQNGAASFEVPCDFTGPIQFTAFNALYLRDVVKHVIGVDVLFSFDDSIKSITKKGEPLLTGSKALITSDADHSFFAIVMPCTIADPTA